MRLKLNRALFALALGCCLSLPPAAQQRNSGHSHTHALLSSRSVKVSIDSGKVANDGRQPGPVVVFQKRVSVPKAEWLRLTFSEATLSGDPAASNVSFLRITSLRDRAVQYLNAVHVEQWAYRSAYFNGDAVLVEVVAYPGTGTNRVVIKRIIAGERTPLEDTLCGPNDRRVLSNDPRCSRHLSQATVCSSWLFNDLNETFLTAGHCAPISGDVEQFNVPLSTGSGAIRHPPPEDQYAVEPTSVQLSSTPGVVGNDWAYFGVFPNSNTGLTPYQRQGDAFALATAAPPPSGQTLRVTGYGSVSPPVSATYNLAQKTHTGPYVGLSGTILDYRVDTTGGNSGGPVILESTQEAIGVHTHGGCTATGGANSGTAIQNAGLQDALDNPRGICASGSGAVSPPLYASGDLNNNFGTANTATGVFGKVSEISAQMQGLAYNKNAGVFYGTDRTKLYRIHPATGAATLIATVSGTTATINGLGYDPNAGVLYGIAQSTGQLLRINTGTAVATPIGAPGGGVIGALDFDPAANKLYGLDDAAGGTRLVEINPTNGTQTLVGPLGSGATDCNGLAFNDRDGQLYTIDAGADSLLRVSPTLGAAILVGPTGGMFGAACGMAVAQVGPENVVPTSLSLFRGVLVSGNLESLHNPDDDRLVSRPGVVLSQAERPIQLIIEGTSPSATPAALRVVVEAHVNIANVSQRVEAFNFTTNSYTQLDQRNMPTSDLRLELDVPNPGEYVRSSDRLIRSRISYKEAGPIFSYPWLARIDEATWRVTP